MSKPCLSLFDLHNHPDPVCISGNIGAVKRSLQEQRGAAASGRVDKLLQAGCRTCSSALRLHNHLQKLCEPIADIQPRRHGRRDSLQPVQQELRVMFLQLSYHCPMRCLKPSRCTGRRGTDKHRARLVEQLEKVSTVKVCPDPK